MRTFKLVRSEDASGVSGTGIVAEGVEFSNGRCVMCWQTATSSVAIYDDVIDLVSIHGHEGRTIVKYDDTGEEVSDLVTAEEVIEEFVASGQEISPDGFAVALDIERLLSEGYEWEEMPDKLGIEDIDVPSLRTLYLIAKATGSI